MLTPGFLTYVSGQVHLYIHVHTPQTQTDSRTDVHTHTPLKQSPMLPLLHFFPSSTQRVIVTFSVTQCIAPQSFFLHSSMLVEVLVPGSRGALLG